MSDTPEQDQSTRPEISEIRKAQTWFLGIIAFAVILFLLVQAKFLLISLAIAIMLFSLTSDAINYFQRMRIGSARVSIWIASVLAVLLIATIMISASLIIIAQANTVVITILQYADPAQQAVADMVGWMGADVETAVLDWMKSIQLGPYLSSLAGQAGNIASGAVLVTLFVGFMFLERLWFPTKLASLMGDERRARRVERIISSIIHRVNRYLVVKVVISSVTGALVYAVMTVFALDLAMPMAVLTFILNFIPNIGSIVATVVVALVSYVQTGDAFTGLTVLSIVTVIQFTVGQVLDPLLLGKTLRLSSFGIIASLAFWAAVWGIVGMFLAVPIMVSIMIICSHIPRVRPVAILLSREGLPDLDLEMEQEQDPAKEPAEPRPSS
ncbi:MULTISPECIES: AI-2E family transporter [unclassified Mameliella]|uniref:AI-2E family transporter n=1 Tax=unclassified Mameliella TaxID=2630630 RepID=UPI00273E0EB0|nr:MULTISPECIES: AI-2E family transporter [unclassified Mameliella]